MKKAIANYIVDIGLLITFIVVFVTGVIKFPGLMIKFGIPLQSLPIRTINWLHDWGGILMGLLVLVHIIFHWNFMKAMTRNFFKKKVKK